MTLRFTITLLLWACLTANCCAQKACRANTDSFSKYGADAGYQWVKCDAVQQMNFYLLTVLAYDAKCRSAIEKDTALVSFYNRYKLQATKPDMDCPDKPACYTQGMFWDSISIATAAKRLLAIYHTNASFRNALHRHLRGSGVFIRWARDDDAVMLEKALRDEMNNLNGIITRYTTNKGFRYPDIDSASFNVRSTAFRDAVAKIFERYPKNTDTPLFFYPSLKIALGLLAANHRNEAARHEPLSGENKEAYGNIARTDWNKYPYSVILILGAGPDDNQPISADNMRRCDAGAALYRQGKAPFIVVSGGYVHPFQTPYSEAIEMRKYLKEHYNIPAGAIIVEPHARHTTTNIRNADRIIFRNGIPADKKILCSSNNLHIASILTQWFSQRNLHELGYIPYAGMEKVSDSTLAYYPVMSSLFWDGSDPLDP